MANGCVTSQHRACLQINTDNFGSNRSMRALRCHSLGDLGSLSVDEVASPDVGPGQVRIGVKAAGVNFPDILMCEGKYQVKPPVPFIPGLEVAGVVKEVGAGINHVKPGDRVLAFARLAGGFAE
jgi:NADPH2:quinone reductase